MIPYDAPEVTIYLCQPQPRQSPIECVTCGEFITEPWTRFFLRGDRNRPTCKKCATRYSYMIEGTSLRCQRAESGAIEIVEVEQSMPSDRELDDKIDQWLTGFQNDDGEGGDQ